MLTLNQLEFRQSGFVLSAGFQVERQTITAVIGPSGGGKSTLLNCIAGFLHPQSGRVVWDGRDITGLPPGERPISIVFQDNNLFGHLTAYENVALGLRPSGRLTGAESQRVMAALEQVGLGQQADRKPAALSGGQQSRVVLARVLVQAKPVLLLDEPFSALGPALRSEMLDLVAELAAETGATLLMVTHDPADVMRIANETIYVEAGVVAKPVATGVLMADPPTGLKAYLGR